MKYGMKERLLGAAVLIFLAVVFIPLFLGNSLDDLPVIQPEQMPKKPASINIEINPFTQPPEVYEIGDDYLDSEMTHESKAIDDAQNSYNDTLPVQTSTLSKQKYGTDNSDSKADSSNTQKSSSDNQSEQNLAKTKTKTIKNSVTSDKSQSINAVQEEELSQQSGIKLQKTGGGKIWCIRMASFADYTAARRYLGALEKKGFSGYWRQINKLGVVFVGPFTSYDAAKTDLSKLQVKYPGKKFFIVKYVNDFTAAKFGTLPDKSIRKSIK